MKTFKQFINEQEDKIKVDNFEFEFSLRKIRIKTAINDIVYTPFRISELDFIEKPELFKKYQKILDKYEKNANELLNSYVNLLEVLAAGLTNELMEIYKEIGKR